MSDLEKFRSETRAWLQANCPPEMRKPMTSDGDNFWGGRNAKFASEPQRIWFERMRDKGWTVPDWPKEYGGGGLDAGEHAVELALVVLGKQVACQPIRVPLGEALRVLDVPMHRLAELGEAERLAEHGG